MQSGELVWAAWSASAILIYLQQEGRTVEQISVPREMKAELRYFLKMYRLNDGSVLLRSGNGNRTHLDVARVAESFQPVEDWPELFAACPPYRIVPLRNGIIAGVCSNQSQLILWQPTFPLQVCSLPEGFVIGDVDIESQRRLWICGALLTPKLNSLKHRRAVAVSDNDGASWQEQIIHGGLKLAWRALFSGAEAAYRTIDVCGGSVILSAETDDYDGTSTFLFVRDAQRRWKGGLLKDDILRAVLAVRDGELEIISHYGQVVSITPRNKWQYRSLLPRIRNLMEGMDKRPPKDARYEILDAQATPAGKRILVISVRVPDNNQFARFGEAVVTLSEKGDKLITFHTRENAEITTASYRG
jgi:hypothetical protein